MKHSRGLLALCLGCLWMTGALSSAQELLLKRYPLDSLEELASPPPNAWIDRITTADGQGALRVEARKPTTLTLFQLDRLEFDSARLIYRAKLRVGALKGEACLALRCWIPGEGEVSVEGLQYALSGTTGWVDAEAVLYLHKQEQPENIRLQVVIRGRGVVWIDDVRLYRAPLIGFRRVGNGERQLEAWRAE